MTGENKTKETEHWGDLSDVKLAPTSSWEAQRLGMAWATGKRSMTNLMMGTENWTTDGSGGSEPDRQKTLVATDEADAIEAVKWFRIAAAMADIEQRELEVHYKMTGQIPSG